MQQKLQRMLDLQNNMNTKVHPQWRDQGYEWYRAIWIESAEMLDHYGWKWWKKQSPDIDQVTLELVDIWHFGLSDLLTKNIDAEAIEAELASNLERLAGENIEFAIALEDFVASTLLTKSFDIEGFSALMQSIDLSFDALFKSYVGKNVLNFFRQDNGYKDGTYRKLWQGREDNEHLVEACSVLDADHPDFQDALYKALEARYQLSE